jgi:hypothetical protein
MALNDNAIPRDLLSLEDTARRFGSTYGTVWMWTKQPIDPLPSYRVGGRIRISEAELVGWIIRRSGRGIKE